MTPPFLDAKIRTSFANQSMMATLGARMAEFGPGHARIECPILPGARQQDGFGHAGLTFAIGDSAAGYAALTLMPEEVEVLTAEMKINLLAPATGDRLVATGKVIRPGRRLIVVSAEITAESGGDSTLIALMQGTMIPMHPRG
jgi:uncharacterized protein (TIGR00369 family)